MAQAKHSMSDEVVKEIKSKIVDESANTKADSFRIGSLLDQLIIEVKKGEATNFRASSKKNSDPAFLGLMAFAVASTLGQFYNLGLVGKGPVFVVGLILGGLIQLYAGFLEFHTGNAFAFTAFSTYGAYWICYAVLLVIPDYTKYTVSDQESAYFLLGFVAITLILLAAAIHLSGVFSLIFVAMSTGLIFMMCHHFWPGVGHLKTVAVIMLSVATLFAYYLLAVHLMQFTYGAPILPVGPPFTKFCMKQRFQDHREAHYSALQQGHGV